MAIKDLTTPIMTPGGGLVFQCWDGRGTNPNNLPRCPNGSNSDSTTPIGPIGNISTDQNKLEGRQEWEYKITLLDVGQGFQKELDPSNIKEIYYEEDVFNAYGKGYIVIDTWQEGLEREVHTTQVPTWHFRNDGRDELLFGLKPINTTGNIDLPPEIWEFNNVFVIYDKEDVGNRDDNKVKKFYFWDKNYQLMQERKIQWSTAIGTRFHTPAPLEPISHLSDLERSMPTGEAIASLLWDAGFGEYIDFDNWDWGGSKIFYTQKANETVWETIDYILSKHVSEEKYDHCIFTRERWTRKYQLIPYYKIFEKAGKNTPGPYQREHIFFEEGKDGLYNITSDLESVFIDKSIISPWKAPLLEGNSYDIDIKANSWGFINSYFFTDMAGIDSSRAMVTKPVHTHWNRKNQFIMNVEANEIETVRDDFIIPERIDYVLGKFPLYTLNMTKKDQISIDPRYDLNSNLDPEQDAITRLVKGRNETAFANLFLNQVFSLSMYGSTHRQCGMFMGIDRIGESDSDFDWKMCGQWYVTKVIHNFLHEKYVNKLIMVKLHAYDEFKLAPDESIT